MDDAEATIDEVSAHLRQSFPEKEIVEFPVPGKGNLAHAFRADDYEGVAFIVEVTHDFVRDTPADRVAGLLRTWQVADELKAAQRGDRFTITRRGLTLSV